MRKVHILIAGVFLVLSGSVCAQATSALSDSSITVTSKDKDLYRLIVGGKEDEIKNYFKDVALDELTRSDTGAIVSALNKLNPKEKITHTIWMLEEAKNRPVEIRKYMYTELEKVNYSKPSFVLKQLINNYFTNFKEEDATLSEKVTSIQRRMNRK